MILTDLDICVLALESTHNVKKMEKCLPYGVKNKLKWKNGLFIKKSVKKVNNQLQSLEMSENKKFTEIITTILFPKMIYAFFKKDALVMQIFISETKKVKFININNEAHEILEIMDEEIALEEYIGFSKSIFYNNIFYDSELNTFEKIQDNYVKGKALGEKLESICEFCDQLENPDYTLIISSCESDEKMVENIVWNIDDNKIKFCSTQNKISNSKIRMGMKSC